MTFPGLHLDTSIVAHRVFRSKICSEMANSADSDETARYEPYRLDLYCLQRYLHIYCSAGMKGLILFNLVMTFF